MTDQYKKPKKKYSLYRQGVNDAIDEMSNVILNEIYINDPYVNKQDIEEKVKYLINKVKLLIK